MARSIEHLVATHEIAQQRRRAGEPAWDRRINIKQILQEEPDNHTNARIAGVAVRVGKLLRKSAPADWLDCTKDDWDSEFEEIVETLEQTSEKELPEGELADWLDDWLEQLYDWADIQRVWLG